MKIFFTKIRLLMLLGLIGIGLASVWFFCFDRATTNTIKNIVLISIDTCRADYLSCYGYQQKTTPCIDRIAGEGTLFTNVIAPAPLTLPSHSSMMTGTIPPFHGVHTNLNSKLGQSNITLAEILKENGFTTGAVISAFVLDSQFGLNQGFDMYSDRFEDNITFNGFNERRGEETSYFALEWLDQHKSEKFFLFLHYYDPHIDYNPPEPFASQFNHNPYAGEIAYTDYCISQVIDKLKNLGLYDSTLVIIAGDHGEMLGEHNEASHSYYIYQGVIKVPLIFRFPGQQTPSVINNVVGLVDIVPTICSLLDIELQPGLSGKDLTPYFNGKNSAASKRYVYCESMTPLQYNANSLQCVLDDQWKYIKTTRPELYNLAADPQESINLLKKKPVLANTMEEYLQEMLKEHHRDTVTDNKIMLDQESINRLASLGYIGDSNAEDNYEFDQERDDPKDLIHYHGLYKSAHMLVLEKQFEEAKALCEKLIESRPDIHMGYTQMGKIAMQQNNSVSAITHFTQAIRLAPKQYEVFRNLGNAFKSQGKFTEAIEQYEQALQLNPDSSEVHLNLGHSLEMLDNITEAIDHYNETLRINPAFAAEAHNRLGAAYLEQGTTAESIKHFTESLRVKHDSAQVHNNLGMVFGKMGRFAEAADHFSKALEIDPKLEQTGYNLGLALEKQGKIPEAIEQYKKAIHLNPNFLYAHRRLASIYSMHPNPEYRDGAEALRLATYLCETTEYKNPHTLDTMAAAYAETGQFAKARETAVMALKLAKTSGDSRLASHIMTKLDLYRSDMPYRAQR